MRTFLAGAALGVGVFGCSSSGGTTPAIDGGPASSVNDASTSVPANDAGTSASDSGADAGVVVPVDAGPRATTCTAAPFVAFAANVAELSDGGASAPLAGAQVGFTTCQGFELATDAKGNASTQLTQGVAVTPIYQGTGVLSALGAEIPARSDVTQSIELPTPAIVQTIPGLSNDSAAAVVEILLAVDPAATAPCNTTSGVTLSVTNHAEASVSYMGASWPADPIVASTTVSTDGMRAFIRGITSASKVTVVGSKPGCSVKLVTASQTGNFLLLGGSLTLGVATITN